MYATSWDFHFEDGYLCLRRQLELKVKLSIHFADAEDFAKCSWESSGSSTVKSVYNHLTRGN